MDIGRFAARAAIGGLFIGHGTQKLFGWFGGPGLSGTEAMMGSLGLHPTRRNAYAAGAAETAGGALLVAGLATPLAAASLIGTMVTAIRKVHWTNGPWAANGGYEYNVALIAALAALVETGPGDLSLDALLGRKSQGVLWALGALAAGAVASAATIEAGRRMAPTPQAAEAGADHGKRPYPDTAGDPVTES